MHDEQTAAEGDDLQRESAAVLARFDAPAFVRRARAVEEAWQMVLHRCREQRERWLLMPRSLLGSLTGMAGRLEALLPLLHDAAQQQVLEALHATLAPRPRPPSDPTSSPRRLKRALRDLVASLHAFNRRWHDFCAAADLAEVNARRESYNCYYLLEKECALGNARLARVGFQRLTPLTSADLLVALPPLPVPRLAD